MNIQVVAKKIDNQWEAAVISDGKFARSFSGKDLSKFINAQVFALLSMERNESTEVSVTLVITDGPAPSEDADGTN